MTKYFLTKKRITYTEETGDKIIQDIAEEQLTQEELEGLFVNLINSKNDDLAFKIRDILDKEEK